MWEAFFLDNNEWTNYTTPHYVSWVIFAILGILFILYSKYKLYPDQQHTYLLYLCLFIWVVQYAKIFIKLYLGNFNYQKDLPLELCNMLPIFMFFAVLNKSRFWWGVFFLLIMSGTFQSTITTTLQDGFPHYEYWRYWIVHMGLTIAVLYGIFVFGYRAKFKDAWYAFLTLNAIGWSVFLINKVLGSNYMYMQAKPTGTTIYNLLGEWPYYLFQIEGLLWVFFFVLIIPFWIIVKFSKDKESTSLPVS